MATDYHKQVRDAVVRTLGALPLPVPVHALDDVGDLNGVGLPCVVCACVGPEQDRPEMRTNLRDGRGFPVAVLLLTGGLTSGAQSPSVPDPTAFRRSVTVAFDQKRLDGVSQVGWCEVSDMGPLIDRDAPAYQKLTTGLVVTAVGRFPRS